jgi:hypothetical protein
MRTTLAAGVVLAVAAVLAVAISSAFDLELESVALLGAALGAVVALVPDRSPLIRVLGFAAGFVIAWLGYIARASLLPDSTSGRAVAVGLVVLLCVLVTAATRDRVPLWSILLGAAAVAGAYEFTYAAAPPELPSTSVSTATTLLFNLAVGFLAAATFAPIHRADPGSATDRSAPMAGLDPQEPNARLDEMMEKTQ